MKRLTAFILALACVLCMAACGNVRNVQVADYTSEIYSDAEIQRAIDVTVRYFRMHFSGCTLTEITYLGDDKLEGYQEFAERHNADEVIVLVSSFDVDASGGDGSLNPNDTYKNWKWILVRTGGGQWRHVDHGY